eukprot:TRINITY_DN11007_c0_g1_i1.p1 TRINITY_DN11007_c0_g1~~TRINITY_DN11007_c0_g1_i1.p1  ORF type:complete len:131 (+),score=45.08 TRINITY_DN11007_c0_g1_i1:120-512(+)
MGDNSDKIKRDAKDIKERVKDEAGGAAGDIKNRIGKGTRSIFGRFERCGEDIAIKTGIGAIIGLLPALILFRGRGFRGFFLGMGSGVGLGWGYSDCDNGSRNKITWRGAKNRIAEEVDRAEEKVKDKLKK